MSRKKGEITHQRKIRIIDILVQNQVATTDNLIQNLNLTSMKNPYAALTHPLKQLRFEGIVPQEKKRSKQKKGAPSQSIQIIKSRETIRTIFDNYPMCVADLYKSGWIQEIIVNDRIKFPMSDESKEELKRYLRASPSFFKYFLTHEKIDEIAHEWFWHVYPGFWQEEPGYVDYNTVLNRYRNGESQLPRDTFHEFFYFCAFIDKMNGVITKDAQKFLKTYKRITKDI